jgi:poly-gamma-glutamate synthesis protein (capsule biosynthesis protein)
MQNADILMVNNEFPYSDRGTPLADKQFTFRAKPSTVSYLDDLGVDIVSLANNHAYDYGEQAFLDTMSTLEEAGIPYVGAGRNLEEASRPVYYIINNMKIAFISATQIERNDNPDTKGATDSSAGVFRCWNGEKLLETIKDARENSDYVIVYLHWGTENDADIDWAQEKQAAEVAEAGADLIIGDHPHCLQPIGVVQGVPVIYSLGNFWFNSKTVDTGLLKVTLNQDGLQACQFIPCLQSACKTTLLQGSEKERVLAYMRSISTGVQIDGEGNVTW